MTRESIADRRARPARTIFSTAPLRLLRKLGAIALALLACVWPAAGAGFDVPDDLPFGKIITLDRNWNRDDCDVLGREQIVCTVESFILCEDFFREDLCERVGLYPSLILDHDYVLYGQRIVESEWYPSDLEQYRLVDARNFDDRYYPPLLVVYLETRRCWWMASRPLWCNRDWTPQYHVIAELDTTRPNVVASGVLSWSQ